MLCEGFAFQKIPACDYHAHAALSHGAIKSFAQKGPWNFFHRYIAKTLPNDEPTPARSLGSAFHAACEDEDWHRWFTEIPKTVVMDGKEQPFNRRLKKHRQWFDLWAQDQVREGRTVLRPGEKKKIGHMIQSVLDNTAAKELLRGNGYQEIAGFAKDVITGLDVKALADVWLPEFNLGEGSIPLVLDFKTTVDHTPAEWSRLAVKKWGYHYQAAWYTDVFSAQRFLFIVVRSEPPWESWVIDCNPYLVEEAREKNDFNLKEIASRTIAQDWHNNGHGGIYNLVDEESQRKALNDYVNTY
jgi:hypothetical protein